MFQFTWYDKREYERIAQKPEEIILSGEFVVPEDIESVKTLYWEEHCLECSPPHCYGNCNHWKKRKDNSCVRLYYGIKNNKKIKDTLWAAEMKFRPWSKLESRINLGSVDVKNLRKLARWDNQYTGLFKAASFLTAPVFKDCKMSRRAEGIKRRKYATIPKKQNSENTFLLQCYSKTAEEFHFCFEITNKENIVTLRKKFKIQPGFNEYIEKITVPLEDNGLIRLYPENDYEADVLLFACDIVKLKEKNIPQQPAKKVKCLAWDLDNTLWNGILIESEPDSLALRDDVLKTIQELDARGVIQIIVSKNNEEDCIPQLKRLGIDEYFVYKFINWNPKSSNLLLAADALNINIDTFAFIDDSHFERAEVSEKLPCVRVYEETQVCDILSFNEFDIVVTEESKNRRLMYQTEAERKKLSMNFDGDNTDFLRSCDIVLNIRKPITEEEINRSFDLIHRTNQLNLSGKKYTKEEFEKILNDTARHHLIAECSDKFGSYGQVAFISFKDDEAITIDEYAMSCRVANKYVESALVKWLKDNYHKDIILKGIKTDRNGLLLKTFTEIGFIDESDETSITLISKANDTTKCDDIVEVKND